MFMTSKSRDMYSMSEVKQKLNPKSTAIHYDLHTCMQLEVNETVEKYDNSLSFLKKFSVNFFCLNSQLMFFKD